MIMDHVSTPKKMFTGWYDHGLVSRAGEDILSDFDDYAAKMLIGNGFTYAKRRSKTDINRLEGDFTPLSIFKIDGVDASTLR